MLNKLYNIAEKENLPIFFKSLNLSNGYCVCEPNCEFICLNKNIINTPLEFPILAEELGHYYTGIEPTISISKDYNSRLIHSRNEFKALKWLSNEIIPFNKFQQVIRRKEFKYEIAEELSIPEEFISKIYNIYEDRLIEERCEEKDGWYNC